MVALKKTAENAAASSSYSAVESANALENLAKAGLEAKDAIATLPAVLALAQAGDVKLSDSADYLSGAIQGMGLSFSDAGRAADVLALGANSSKTSVKGVAEALSYAAPVAKSLGVSLESTVAMIGQFSNASIDASRAGTALNSIMSQFQDPGSKFRGELSAAGITTGNFEEALHQLAKAGAIGGKAILAVGQEAGPALVGLLNLGMPALDELKGKLLDSAGSAQKFAEVMKNNLSGSMSGLASAWEALQIKLGTPVLPVLKDAVDQLAGALKAAVADGTAQRFGEAIAAAFQSGAKWAKDFVAQINFTQISADLRAFADKTGAAFTQIGEYASMAGNSAKLAYGVMAAGGNTVLALLYTLRGAFAEMAAKFSQSAVALYDGLAKINLGNLSERFKQAAEKARNAAQGFGETAQAMRDKAAGAMQDVADRAQLARDGFTGLTTAATSAAPAVSSAAVAFDDLGAKLEETRQKSHDAEKATTDKKTADEAAAVALRQLRAEYAALIDKGDVQGAAEKIKEINKALQGTPPAAKEAAKATAEAATGQKQATEAASAAVAKLRDEYKALVASGDAQGAAEKIKEINKALQATPPASKEAAEKAAAAAKAIADAFAGLGITSQAELKRAAESARIYYDRIKGDTNSTTVDIANAFKVMAEKAIAANNGIAPSWVTAQSAARGYEVQVDGAGKATLRAVGEAVKSVDGLAQSYVNAGRAAETASERAISALERQNAAIERANAAVEKSIELENKRLNMDAQGFSLDKTGKQTVNQGAETWMSILNQLKSYGVDESAARQLAYEFTPDGGKTAPYSASAAQKKYGGEFGTISYAIQQAAQQYLQSNPPASKTDANSGGIQNKTYTVNIDSGQRSSIQTASESDAQKLIKALQGAKLTAS